MTYLKVLWKHENEEYPVILYSELANDRFEVRKVESFIDGSLCYAYDGGSSGTTALGEAPVPTIEEIASEVEFEPTEISKSEFEKVWAKAVSD